MPSFRAVILSLCLLSSSANEIDETEAYESRYTKLGCTAVVVGKGATVDGSLITTHNADCMNCDYRIARTPAMTHAAGATKTILKYKPDYPHFVTDTRSDVWSPENIDDKLVQRPAWSTPEYINSLTLGVLPEVEQTYAVVEGLFGIMNEVGVAIGESTCASIWYGKPPRACPECDGPQIDMSFLTIIALERCATARCAIELMGGLAQSLGYYAAEPTESEGGEGLTVIDNTEAWVFHILPDESGDGVVWVAQRVPDTHVAAIANAFIIREVEENSDDFITSPNLWSAAEEAGIWKPADGKLDFALVYGYDSSSSAYSTRRQWRVLDIVAPSLNLPSEVNWVGDGLPFSVEVDKKITVRDVMAIKRDFYEGTKFDLSKGVGGGPYGDPRRFDGGANTDYNQNNVTVKDEKRGGYERAISMFRTSYSQISVSRQTSDENQLSRAVVWVSQYAPHMSVYVPIFVGAGDAAVPKPLSTGSLWRADKESTFWKACAVGNWAAHFFKYAIVDVRDVQKELEDKMFSEMASIESQAAEALTSGDKTKGMSALAAFSAQHCSNYFNAYDNLFTKLIAKYHDGYSVADPDAVGGIDMRRLFYPRWWLRVSGFWSKYDFPPDDPHSPNYEAYEGASSSDSTDQSEETEEAEMNQSESSFVSLFGIFSYTLVAAIAGKLGVEYGKKSQAIPAASAGYSPSSSSLQSVELGSMSRSPSQRGEYAPVNKGGVYSYQNGDSLVKPTRVQMEC